MKSFLSMLIFGAAILLASFTSSEASSSDKEIMNATEGVKIAELVSGPSWYKGFCKENECATVVFCTKTPTPFSCPSGAVKVGEGQRVPGCTPCAVE